MKKSFHLFTLLLFASVVLHSCELFETEDVDDKASPHPASRMTIPNRQLTEAEIAQYVADYWEIGGHSDFQLEVIRLVNNIRREHNLEPVQIDDRLMIAARFYAQTMVQLNGGNIGHNIGPYAVPGATHGASRNIAEAFGARLRWNGGNAAGGNVSPEKLVDMWMNSEGHRRYILSPEHRYGGTGSYAGGRFGACHYLFLSDNPNPITSATVVQLNYLQKSQQRKTNILTN